MGMSRFVGQRRSSPSPPLIWGIFASSLLFLRFRAAFGDNAPPAAFRILADHQRVVDSHPIAPPTSARTVASSPPFQPTMGSVRTLLFPLAVLVAVASSQSIPHVTQCEGGEAPVFLLQHNSTNGVRLRQVPTANFIDCTDLCANSNHWRRGAPSAQSAQLLMRVLGLPAAWARDCQLLERFDRKLFHDLQDCVAVEYADGQCHLIGAQEQRYEPAADSAPLATKNCVKSERICASPFHFDVHEQMILVGFAREVVPADSIQVCLSACLNAFDTFGFECESVMYYPVDAECILNTEDRLDRPDLFVEEKEDTVIYMDNNCAGSQCYAPYVTQYVAVEGRQLHAELDRRFADVDLESCEQLCTQRVTLTKNDFNCKSFMYNNATRECILSDERSTPLGRGNLTEAVGFNYYEKKCFASPRTCRNVASFTRVPQMLLVGFAAFVMENVPSVTMCLDQCTNPPPETGDKFVCKSAMYYYNEQECILNAESRQSKPDLFIPEEEDFVVDYFDINCHLGVEKCALGKELAAVRAPNAALPEGDGSLHVIESVTGGVGECMTKCFGMAPEKCRSFNFDKDSKLCNLLYLDGKTTLRPQVKTGIDLYDMHCLSPAPAGCLAKEGARFSRYLYTKQPAIPAIEKSVLSLTGCLELCAAAAVPCQGVNYNRRSGSCALFPLIDARTAIADDHVDLYVNLCAVAEDAATEGLSGATNVPKEESHSVKVVGNEPGPLLKGDRANALNQLPAKKPKVSEKESPRFRPPNPDAVVPSNVGGSLDLTNKGPAGPPVLIPPEAVHTVCNYEGMKIQIKNKVPFSGVVFVKNKYDSCRIEAGGSDSVTLNLGLPSNFGMKPIVLNAQATPDEKQAELAATNARDNSVTSNEIRRRRQAAPERDCGLVDLDNGTYKTTVVVQTNNLGIPGLVTSMDQIYEVSCDYSSMLGGKVSTAANMTVHGPKPADIQPRGKIELGNPVLMQMLANGSEGGKPLIQAKLGDILELRWEIMAMDEELDFFVRDCEAVPGAPGARDDEKLQLIEQGCPTPAVAQKLIPNPIEMQSSAVKVAKLQAFRFDSSPSVRVTCHLELCKGTCTPVECNTPNGAKQSWGRKKRAVDEMAGNDVTEFVTKRYKVPRYAQATTSLVIIDPLQQVAEPAAQQSLSLNKYSPVELANQPPVQSSASSTFDRQPVVPEGHMCMSKALLLAVLGTLLLVILVQAVLVGKFIFQRLLARSATTATADDKCY